MTVIAEWSLLNWAIHHGSGAVHCSTWFTIPGTRITSCRAVRPVRHKSLVLNPLLNWIFWFSGLTSTRQQFWAWFVLASDDSQHGKIDLSCKRTQLLSLCLLYLIIVSAVVSYRAQLNKKRPEVHLPPTVIRDEAVHGQCESLTTLLGLFVLPSVDKCCSWNSSSMYIPVQHF